MVFFQRVLVKFLVWSAWFFFQTDWCFASTSHIWGGCKTCSNQCGTMKFCVVIELQSMTNFWWGHFCEKPKIRTWRAVGKFSFTFCFMVTTHELLYLDEWSFVQWNIVDVHTSSIWINVFFDRPFEVTFKFLLLNLINPFSWHDNGRILKPFFPVSFLTQSTHN
jgi:hypothetical protein